MKTLTKGELALMAVRMGKAGAACVAGILFEKACFGMVGADTEKEFVVAVNKLLIDVATNK